VLNRRWFKTLFRGRYGTVRIMQLVPIAGLAVCIVGQIASALVLSKYALGFLPALPGASWARRVHMLCSYWSFVFAFAHAGAQFKGFARLARTNMHAMPSVAIWLARALVTTISCYGVYAFVRMGLGGVLARSGPVRVRRFRNTARAGMCALCGSCGFGLEPVPLPVFHLRGHRAAKSSTKAITHTLFSDFSSTCDDHHQNGAQKRRVFCVSG
jgi:hypothetical protein